MVTHLDDASDTYLGYLHQGYYALVLLLDDVNCDAVCLEAGDDVVLEGANAAHHQLKHSIKKPRPLTEKDPGLWKAIGRWAAMPNRTGTKLVFVTCAGLGSRSLLAPLTHDVVNRGSSLDEVIKALVTEAQRVQAHAKSNGPSGNGARYAKRVQRCSAFLAMVADARRSLVTDMRLVTSSFTISQVQTEVSKRLRTWVPKEIVSQVTHRLLERWGYRVLQALLDGDDHRIYRQELLQMITELIWEMSSESLPDDFSGLEPTPAEEKSLRGGNMEGQIRLVDSGNSRIKRAVLARWRARCQRDRWMSGGILYSARLDKFDKELVGVWEGRHGPMVDDFAGEAEDVLCEKGLQLLDWSHHDAPTQIPPIRSGWKQPFLVQGSYQQLADELRVGWHPHFRQKLRGTDGDAEESEEAPRDQH